MLPPLSALDSAALFWRCLSADAEAELRILRELGWKDGQDKSPFRSALMRHDAFQLCVGELGKVVKAAGMLQRGQGGEQKGRQTFESPGQLETDLGENTPDTQVQKTALARQEAARQFDRHEQLSSLPEPVTGLLPRQELLDAIDERLAKAPVVVLYGLGGAGKSQLALQYARRRQRLVDQKEEAVTKMLMKYVLCFVILIGR